MKQGSQNNRPAAKPCGRASSGRQTSRRVILEALLGLGATSALYGFLDEAAWRAFEAVEESWIRDRHELLIQQAPAALGAARLDLEIRLADLRLRALQFRHLLSCNPSALRGGVWQMTALPVSQAEDEEMRSTSPEYRRQQDRIRQLNQTLQRHPQAEILRRAQMRLWKTPQYREIHRRYTGKMQELQNHYGTLQPDAAASGID